MPPDDGTVQFGFSNQKGETMSQTEQGNLTVALTAMANEAGAAAGRRLAAADQLSSDSQRMWSIAMVSPTVMSAHGMRIAAESGHGRTRIESNSPADSQTVAK
jgi:hypothetical protein